MKKTTIVMLGIRRSGNSPLRNFLADQFQDTKVFLNATPDIIRKHHEGPTVISLEEMPVEVLAGNKNINILLLRDPANLFASRVKHYDALSSGKKFISPMVTGLWVNHAKRFLNPGQLITVNHRTFLTDIEYRKELSEKIGGTFSDDTLDFVDDNGQGSSFDGLAYDGEARTMPVFERWKHYKDLECFRNLFTDEIVELATQIFGEGPWTELYS